MVWRSVVATLVPHRPVVSARQILSGEVPISALRTRYIALVCLNDSTGRFGDLSALFTAIEWLEVAGWEVVSFSAAVRDFASLTFAYPLQPSRPARRGS